MEIKEIIRKLGGIRKVALEIGLRPTSIQNWIHYGYIPARHHDMIITLAEDKGMDLSPVDLDPQQAGE